MKRIVVMLIVCCSCMFRVWAVDGCNQNRMGQQEFRAKQQAFITEKAQLTEAEAENFFPVYFELQDRKKQLNDEIWKLYKKGRGEDISESQYEEILVGISDIRLEISRLEKTYLEKFKKVLSSKKIYMVQHAELKFHRYLVKGMQRSEKKPPFNKPKNK